jgi:hypothetical protein
MRNSRQARHILLAIVAVVVCIHVLWNIIAAVLLPWALAILIFLYLGGIGRLFFKRWRRW